jgi:hypothetical protein
MDADIADGQITMNAQGTRYTASYRVGWGVIAVTLGSMTRVTHVASKGIAPDSVARAVLRTMVRERARSAIAK